MSGQDLLDGFAFGVAMALLLSLSWSLFGPELAIILGGTTALGIVLSRTPSPRQKRAPSQKILRRYAFSPSEYHSAGETVPQTTRRPVHVIKDSPESCAPRIRNRSKHLAAVQRSMSFDEAL